MTRKQTLASCLGVCHMNCCSLQLNSKILIPQKMGSKMNSSNSPILCRLPTNQPYNSRSNTIAFSSFCNRNQQAPTDKTQTQLPKAGACTVKFRTLGACKLGISRYPDFEYNAQGGTGTGTVVEDNDLKDQVSVCFDLETLYIPPLTTATTRFLGLPLPPFLRIDIVPELFRGNISQESGKVDLEFRAKFLFSVGNIYRAPPLMVGTVLTSEESEGRIRRGRGERLDGEGKCRLVGVATVEAIDDVFMNTFLGLPTECLANLNAVITYSTP